RRNQAAGGRRGVRGDRRVLRAPGRRGLCVFLPRTTARVLDTPQAEIVVRAGRQLRAAGSYDQALRTRQGVRPLRLGRRASERTARARALYRGGQTACRSRRFARCPPAI